MTEPDDVVVDVEPCPRCGRRHEGLRFTRLAGGPIYCGPFETLTHWGSCPATSHPILLGKQALSQYHDDGVTKR